MLYLINLLNFGFISVDTRVKVYSKQSASIFAILLTLNIFFMTCLTKVYGSLWVKGKCLQCFDTVGWAAGRASGLLKLSGGVLAWLSAGTRYRLAYGPADATAIHCQHNDRLTAFDPGQPG